jgi:TRAP-type transport system periplasmic protein
MFKIISRVMFAAFAVGAAMAPSMAGAEPINLKLSFFTSDRSEIYQGSVKPFVDAVNAEGSGLVHIEVFFSGAISSDMSRQAQIVGDDTADLALVVPATTPERFYDTSVMELAGLFRNAEEASRVYAQFAGSGRLAGYGDFYVVCAFVSGTENINSRKPTASIADLKGQTIRVDNLMEADVLQRLGAVPVMLSINRTTEAISSGAIEGATVPPSMLFEFGIGRVTTHHYMIGVGGVPVALLMNRKRFESMPENAQSIIRRYGGQWLGAYSEKHFDELDRQVLQTLETDPRRTVIFPSVADEKSIRKVYQDVIDEYAGSSDHNRELLAQVHAELAKLRTSE